MEKSEILFRTQFHGKKVHQFGFHNFGGERKLHTLQLHWIETIPVRLGRVEREIKFKYTLISVQMLHVNTSFSRIKMLINNK